MGRKFYRNLRNIALRNAPSSSASPSTGGGGLGNINRDPKTFSVARLGYALIAGAGGGGRDNFESPTVDLQLIDDVISKDSYASQAVTKYSELVLKSGYQFKWKNEQSFQYVKNRLDVMAEATDIPTDLLFQGMVDDLVRYSNCFIVKARAKKGVGLPPGLPATPVLPAKEAVAGYFRLAPKTITISREEDGTINGYRQEIQGGSGDPIDFKPEDIIHLTINQGVGNAFGDPFLATVIEDIRLLRKIEENVAVFIYRHIFPLLKYQVGESSPGKEATPDEITEAQQALDNIPADGGIVLPERHSLESLNIQAVDMKEYLKYFENRVLSGLGMTQVDMGRGDTANRNTADAMSDAKMDRIKSWQRSLEAQISHELIEELLIEGGFDPLVNSEFRVSFSFNEIENEKRIALENHAIQKWNNNLITFEEARQEVGYDPVADEGRLSFKMMAEVAMEQAQAAAQAVDNKDKPENQHGKKSAPKESIMESYENTKAFVQSEYALNNGFNIVKNILEDVRSYAVRQIREGSQTSYTSTAVELSRQKFNITMKESLYNSFGIGVTRYKEETNRIPTIKTASKEMAISYSEEWFTKFNKDLTESVSEIVNSEETNTNKLIKLNIRLERFQQRYCTFAEFIYSKVHEYGFLMAAIEDKQYSQVVIESDHACTYCEQQHEQTIDIVGLSEIEQRVLFHEIPPYHANCKCSLRGGEI